jgi:pimeloyl-ACP methyl ester carboxylesterase
MPRALAGGIELEYDTFGSPDDPALLLIMGFTAQLIAWDPAFCEQLAAGRHYVIRFDNRDCGLSTCFDSVAVDLGAVMSASIAGEPLPPVPYSLSDMAGDAVGLLDHLGIERAHVMGASMGGMIAQTVAVEHPSRVTSLISVMSMTGELEYGTPTPEAMAFLMAPPPKDRAETVRRAADTAIISSRRYFDLARTEEEAGQAFDRHFYPEGAPRQLAAIYASGSRADAVRKVEAPTLVIHGLDDTLITPSGGQRTAELVPGASLLMVADMGHDLPRPLWPFLTGAILGFTATAAGETTSATPAAAAGVA